MHASWQRHSINVLLKYSVYTKSQIWIEPVSRRKWIAVLVFFAGLVGSYIVWAAGSQLTNAVPVVFRDVPGDVAPVKFESESGSDVSGWVFDAEDPSAIAVLMHGIRSNRMQMVRRAEHLQEMGISSLVFDFQAHGESPGKLITLGYLESYDAQAAVRLMQSQNPDLPTIVIGVSMGGAASVLASPALDIDVLVLESVYSDAVTAISNRLQARIPGGRYLTPLLALQIKPRAGIDASRLSPVAAAYRVKAATLVLSGDLDVHTTVDDTRQLFESLPMPKQLGFMVGAGHTDLEKYDSESYWRIVEPFMEQYLTE